jgi:hypothetical protein
MAEDRVYTLDELRNILKTKIPFVGQSELMTDNARKSNSKLRPDGYVYILKLKGFDIYKIGVSANPERRIKDIDSANPFGINILCLKYFKNVYNLEECIHDSFKNSSLRKEWFRLDKESVKILIKQINKLSEKGIYLIRR